MRSNRLVDKLFDKAVRNQELKLFCQNSFQSQIESLQSKNSELMAFNEQFKKEVFNYENMAGNKDLLKSSR